KSSNVAALLSNAYRNSLRVARENNIQYVAFPAISCGVFGNSLRVARENNIQYVAFPAVSCGVFGYPFDEAATVAISTIKEHCNDIKEVHFVLFADDIYKVWVEKAEELLPN
nr:appr-1-p processing [Tanacetum cinerariifolium]